MKPPVFKVSNHHPSGAEAAPEINGDTQKKYFGYYENESREQFIFVYDYETRSAKVWVGDADWEAFDVEDGRAPQLVMGRFEAMWLYVCWNTATMFLE
jgi:hypothetical protein